jgi:opacity protein-like surface antigen
MRHATFGLVAAIAAVSMIHADLAVAEEGFYIEAHGGGVMLTDSDIHVDGGGSGDIEFDNGYMIGGALGYAFEQGFRIEGAMDYRHNDIDDNTASGNVNSLAGMFNGIFQLPVDFPVKPYIGAGLGLANIRMDANAFGSKFLDDDDTVFAYQGMAGITYEVNPAVAVGAGYIYFATQDATVKTKAGTGFDAEYASHNFMIQLRFSTYPTGAF